MHAIDLFQPLFAIKRLTVLERPNFVDDTIGVARIEFVEREQLPGLAVA